MIYESNEEKYGRHHWPLDSRMFVQDDNEFPDFTILLSSFSFFSNYLYQPGPQKRYGPRLANWKDPLDILVTFLTGIRKIHTNHRMKQIRMKGNNRAMEHRYRRMTVIVLPFWFNDSSSSS